MHKLVARLRGQAGVHEVVSRLSADNAAKHGRVVRLNDAGNPGFATPLLSILLSNGKKRGRARCPASVRIEFGGAGGIRTRCLLLAKQALSQVSYSPVHLSATLKRSKSYVCRICANGVHSLLPVENWIAELTRDAIVTRRCVCDPVVRCGFDSRKGSLTQSSFRSRLRQEAAPGACGSPGGELIGR